MDARFDSFPFQDGQFPPLGERAYAPVLPTQAMAFTDDEEWEVVGESRYLDGIRRIKAIMDADDEGGTLYAQLIAEPMNPFDRHAVRVDLVWGYERETCGYLPREHAFRLQPLVVRAADDGLLVFREASLYGGTSGKPNIGVWLSSPPVADGVRHYADLHEELASAAQPKTAENERRSPAMPTAQGVEPVPGATHITKKSFWKRLGF